MGQAEKNSLKMQFEKMRDEGYLHRSLEETVYFADTPREAIAYINKHM